MMNTLVSLEAVNPPHIFNQASDLFYAIARNRQHLSKFSWARAATLNSTLEFLKGVNDNETFRLIRYNGNVAGAVTLRFKSTGVTEIGYWVRKEYQGMNIASTAVHLILNESPIGGKVIAHIRQTNVRSLAVLNKNEFAVSDFYVLNGETWLNLVRYT